MKKIRFAFLLLFLSLLATACTADNESSGEGESSSTAKHTTNGLALIPENSAVVFYANLAALKDTPMGEKLHNEFDEKLSEEGEDEDYLDFVEKTGLDLRKDVYEIWAAGTRDKSADEPLGGAIITGKFDEKRIIDYMRNEKSSKITEEQYRDTKIYTSDKDDTAFAFLDDNSLIAGKSAWVKEVIDHEKDGGKSLLDNRKMMDYIGQVPYKEHLWGVVDLNEYAHEWASKLRQHQTPFKGTESLENMQTLIFSTHVEDKAKVYIAGNFTTPEQAKLVADMLNGFIAMGKLMVSDDRDAVDMLNDIDVHTEGPNLTIRTDIDKSFLDKLKEKQRKYASQHNKLL